MEYGNYILYLNLNYKNMLKSFLKDLIILVVCPPIGVIIIGTKLVFILTGAYLAFIKMFFDLLCKLVKFLVKNIALGVKILKDYIYKKIKNTDLHTIIPNHPS